jgi:very-short-patch-repair endonuclease
MTQTAVPAPTLPRHVSALAERQHGLLSVEQLVHAGLSRSAVRHQLATGGWVRLTPRVLQRSGSPPSDGQTLMATILDVGPMSFISHRSAAAWWGIPGFRLEPVDVMVLRGGRQTPTSRGVVHRPRHLPDPFATMLGGVPVVRPALVVLQLASVLHPERLRRLVDRMWADRLLSGPSLRAELDPVLGRGRPGTTAVRGLLDSLPDDYVPPATGLEGRASSIFDTAGLGPYRRQVDLGSEVSWCGRVDLRHESLPLIVEIDSERFHRALTDEADDDARAQRLTDAGFALARVTDVEVWHQPAVAVARVRAAESALRRRSFAARHP